MVLLDKRKEVLRLYREILRTTRTFPHRNEQGQPWSDDGETISKRILFGWKCLQEVQEKMMEKQQELASNPDSEEKR
ncbi:hypothetical protein PInf_018842 [Phytophthora infestans]|nr:hypothetical protein PInf_018842 [Phytophthora infestans]